VDIDRLLTLRQRRRFRCHVAVTTGTERGNDPLTDRPGALDRPAFTRNPSAFGNAAIARFTRGRPATGIKRTGWPGAA
jgi:hypothetical protein